MPLTFQAAAALKTFLLTGKTSMIVLFGASSDIGQRLHRRLEIAGLEVRKVSRRLPGGFKADLATRKGVDEVVKGADKVVSCAHARYTDTILKACAPGTPVVLTGSTWRFSKVPNPAADQVRAAERVFLAGSNPGVMLHSTMIYGGHQERNVQRLLSMLKRFPIIPIPGGGRQVVRPSTLTIWSNAFSGPSRKSGMRRGLSPLRGLR
jgi:nucleoside-diphosphate-sugar epimerase